MRYELHVLSSPELSAPELQLPASRGLPRMPEVFEALRVRTEGTITRLRAGSTNPERHELYWLTGTRAATLSSGGVTVTE